MALTVPLYGSSGSTIGTTEYSLTNNSTTLATKTDNVVITVWIDVTNLAAGDEYEVALYEKAYTGGTQRKITLANLVGAQTDGLFVTGSFHVAIGWDVTMKKISGTDRSIAWSIRSAG